MPSVIVEEGKAETRHQVRLCSVPQAGMYAELFVRGEGGRIYRSLLWFNTLLYLECREPKYH